MLTIVSASSVSAALWGSLMSPADRRSQEHSHAARAARTTQPLLLSAEDSAGIALEPRSRLMLRPRKSCSAFLVPPGFRVGAGDDTPVAEPTIHWPFKGARTIRWISASGIEVPPCLQCLVRAWAARSRTLWLSSALPPCARCGQSSALWSSAGLTSSPCSDDAPPTSLASSLLAHPAARTHRPFGSCGNAEFRGVPPVGSAEAVKSGLSGIGLGRVAGAAKRRSCNRAGPRRGDLQDLGEGLDSPRRRGSRRAHAGGAPR